MLNQTLIESRVDYLTCTTYHHWCTNPAQFQRQLTRALDVLQAEKRRGDDVKGWRMESFNGFTSGRFSIAQNDHGLLIRLSSDLAAMHWHDFFLDATNVSRIDCAATFREDGPWTDRTQTHLDEVRSWASVSSPRLRVTRIDGGLHGNSLMVGSRSSEAYARIYDKYAESKHEAYQDCWRYEVEFKKRSALRVAFQLSETVLDVLGPARLALGWLTRRNVDVGQIHSFKLERELMPAVTCDERKYRWLRRSVAPLVSRLIKSGHLAETLDALGLSNLVQPISKDCASPEVISIEGEH